MQYHYALAEGAMFRPVRWTETSGEEHEFSDEMDMFRYAGKDGWELVTVYVSGKTGNYRQYYFKQLAPYAAAAADSSRATAQAV